MFRCRYPPLLGLRPDTLQLKLDATARLLSPPLPPERVRAAIIGFPNLLGLSSGRLAGNWQRLSALARARPEWAAQLAACPPKTLGRVCAAGDRCGFRVLSFMAHVRDHRFRSC